MFFLPSNSQVIKQGPETFRYSQKRKIPKRNVCLGTENVENPMLFNTFGACGQARGALINRKRFGLHNFFSGRKRLGLGGHQPLETERWAPTPEP